MSAVFNVSKVMSLIKEFRTTVIAGLICIACSPWALAIADDATPATNVGQNASPEAIVDAQLAAYNRRDLEGFLSFYAEDAVLANHPANRQGRDAH